MQAQPVANPGLTATDTSPVGDPPLSAVLTAQHAAHFATVDARTRYVASFGVAVTLRGKKTRHDKTILWEIMQRFKKLRDSHRVPPPIYRIAMPCPVLAAMASEFESMVKRHSNFSGRFEFMDLLAIGEQLAAGLARFRSDGRLTCDMLRDHQPSRIRQLSVADDPVTADMGSVYIPRQAELLGQPGAFYAIAAGANAYGSLVYTDVLAVNGAAQPLLQEPTDSDLALGVVTALRMLTSMYNRCGHGVLMAYAITRGIHRVLSVVGHTDEGAYMRDVLRRHGFAAPFGAVYTRDFGNYHGLPSPAARDPAAFTSVADTIALVTAGAVAVADPLTAYKGMLFPTTTTGALHADPGTDQVPVDAAQADVWANRNATAIANSSGPFCEKYAKVLGEIFCVAPGGEMSVVRHLSACMSSLVDANCRHLRHATVAVFYWVEPTGLFHKVPDYESSAQHYGVLAGTGAPTHRSLFDGPIHVEGATALFTDANLCLRTVRRHPGILFLQGHPEDGLANIVPRQLVSENVLLSGGGVAGLANTIGERLANSEPINSYMWVRGQCKLPAPAEFLNAGVTQKILFFHQTFDPHAMELNPTHMFTAEELRGMADLIATKPFQLPNTDVINDMPRNVRHAVTRAAAALRDASMRVGGLLAMVPLPPALEIEPDNYIENDGVLEHNPTSGVDLSGPPHVPTSATHTGRPVGQVYFDGTGHVRPPDPRSRGAMGGGGTSGGGSGNSSSSGPPGGAPGSGGGGAPGPSGAASSAGGPSHAPPAGPGAGGHRAAGSSTAPPFSDGGTGDASGGPSPAPGGTSGGGEATA